MPSGFRNGSGTDLDSVFALYSSGTKPAATGFRTSDSVDLNQRYQPGNSGLVTGFRTSGGTDLGSIFAIPSGTWAISASPNPADGSRFDTGNIVSGTTITSSGHIGPLTYSTTWLSGGAGITIGSGTTNNPSFSSTQSTTHTTDITKSGTARIIVTDTGNGGATRSIDVPVTHTYVGTG